MSLTYWPWPFSHIYISFVIMCQNSIIIMLYECDTSKTVEVFYSISLYSSESRLCFTSFHKYKTPFPWIVEYISSFKKTCQGNKQEDSFETMSFEVALHWNINCLCAYWGLILLASSEQRESTAT